MRRSRTPTRVQTWRPRASSVDARRLRATAGDAIRVLSRERKLMLEQKVNEIFGDAEPTGFGTGWWSGVLSAFFGLLAFGAVITLHFPGILSSPELRPYYPMFLMRLLIQAVIVGSIILGVVSAMLRRKKVLAL